MSVVVSLWWVLYSCPLSLVESSTRTIPHPLQRDSSLLFRRNVGMEIPPDAEEEEKEKVEDELLLHLLQQQQQRQYDRIQILSAARILESSSPGVSPSIPDDTDNAMTTTTTPITNQQPPRMNLQDMAHVLQFTSGLNAQLQQVCRSTSRTLVPLVDPPRRILQQRHVRSSHQRMDDLRGGGGGGGMVESRRYHHHHSTTEPYRIRPGTESTSQVSPPTPFWTASSLSSSTATIDGGMSNTPTDVSTAFQSPVSNMEHLHDYLLQVHQLLRDEPPRQRDDMLDDEAVDSSTTALERTLMMLYLDRACRHGGGGGSSSILMKQLPYCTPSTVHYLCVTAMCVAAGTVRGDLISLLSTSRSSTTTTTTTTEHWNNSCDVDDDDDDHMGRYDRILTSSPFMQSLFQKLQVHLNIPVRDSQRRVAFMLQALDVRPGRNGHNEIDDIDDEDEDEDDAGIFVTPTALQEWKEQWESKFS